ncbi:hypothetical protein FT663_03967 [Candidozyma haemuli var. vulneris]|nr:hypothetical protein FT662_04021 [[Candida] haemuloni var. vulneris]KAF3988611.1 hypothetical protein FT663_03967 [[Candida] haemuloni var. vulneris]
MDIPLKSSPRVSISTLDHAFPKETHEDVPESRRSRRDTHLGQESGSSPNSSSRNVQAQMFTSKSPQLADTEGDKHERNYRLARTYSETEFNNFDSETGHRLYDDGIFRSRPSKAGSPQRHDGSAPKLYSRSYEQNVDTDSGSLGGLEDEYIPGLDFADVVRSWNPTTRDSSAQASREHSYLDLRKLHAQVAPQPIQFRNPSALGKHQDDDSIAKPPKKHKSSPSPTSGISQDSIKEEPHEINYESILASLPNNFTELPYSQRKKVVKSFSESIDYSQFSLYVKNQLGGERSCSTSSRTHRSYGTPVIGSSGGSLRRSRRNSTTNNNTVAGRLLALSSSADLRKLDKPPKVNVDEKGAMVLGYELGRVIGFGAWGTIRECFSKDGEVKAIKTVKSIREYDNGNNSPKSKGKPVHNPKVLSVFRKEIEIWRQLQHPSLLPLLDHTETEDTIFCLTNRISGGTLFEVVSRWGVFNDGISNTSGPVGFSISRQKRRLFDAAQFIRQIVEALLYMHQELGIVHGDLKLENVLVDDSDTDNVHVVLCDFGMSRVFAPRLSRKSSRRDVDDSTSMLRSKSSATQIRKPFHGGDSPSLKNLFSDDSKIGISHFHRSHGPSLQSLDLTPTNSKTSLADFHEFKVRDQHIMSNIESELPHSHIGSLPYASPELLEPQPPPLGPSADIWALGVVLFTMVVGKLPFQHPFEPRLRAIISAGKFDKKELKQACLMAWIYDDDEEGVKNNSFVDAARQKEIAEIKQVWEQNDRDEFEWVYNMVEGCLERDITKRWDLFMMFEELKVHENQLEQAQV